jgi:hypothetical protein
MILNYQHPSRHAIKKTGGKKKPDINLCIKEAILISWLDYSLRPQLI